MRRILTLSCLAVSLALSACAGKHKDETPYVERPVEALYNMASKKLDAGLWLEAASLFEEVDRQHPYSEWARRSVLMAAYSYYEANKYDDATAALDRYISLHPGGNGAPYAYYLRAICWYERISDVGRDQQATQQAMAALQDVMRRYPGTDYARDAQYKYDMTQDHLAGKEMSVGRWYLKQGQTLAAIKRFKVVTDQYQTTTHVAEALYRLTEGYLTLGVTDEAYHTAAVLGYNYPGSDWYADVYKLMSARGHPLAEAPKKSGFLEHIGIKKPAVGDLSAPPADVK